MYRQERDRVFALCHAILREPHDAEDAVQEAFARIAGHLDALSGDPSGYVMRAARNVCLNELRRRARQQRRLLAGEQQAQRSAEDAATDRELLVFLWRDLTRYERVLIGSVFSGLSLAEIATRAGTSVEATAQRISRARRRIRQLAAAPLAVLAPLASGQAALGAVLRRLSAAVARRAVELFDPARMARSGIGPMLAAIVAGLLALPSAMSTAPPATPSMGPGHGAARHGTAVLAADQDAAGRSVTAPSTHSVVLDVPPPGAASTTPPAPPTAPPIALPEPDSPLTSFTPSPDYAHDHTIFAPSRCPHRMCPLYRSDDAGDSWHRLAAWGLLAQTDPPTILLPPSYPKDPAVFVSEEGGLYRSDDGGASFRLVAPQETYPLAAIDPTSAVGDTRIFFTEGSRPDGYATLMLYSGRTGAVVPATALLPATVAGVTSLFTAPGAHAVYVDTMDATRHAAMYACAGIDPCHYVGPTALPWLVDIVPSPTFASDSTFFLRTSAADSVSVVSTVDGHQANLVLGSGRSGVAAVMPALDYATSHRVDVLLEEPGATLGLRLVGDKQTAWSVATPQYMNDSSLTRLPDGSLLAERWGPTSYWEGGGDWQGGLYCSHDDGITWALAC